MNIMKIGAALALAAVKVSRGWSRHLKETSSRVFQAAAEIAAANVNWLRTAENRSRRGRYETRGGAMMWTAPG